MSQQKKPEENEELWYNHKRFRRFWEQYNRVMEWRQRHQMGLLKAQCAAQQVENEALRAYFMTSVTAMASDTSSPSKSNRKHRNSRKNSNAQLTRNRPSTSSSSKDTESEELTFEVSDEFVKFLEQSDHHRRQLKAEREATQKQEREKNNEDGTKGAPTERPGTKRTAEMKLLYGKRAAVVHGMETAVQLQFNKNCDYFQPKLWPVMPIKLTF